MFFVLAPYSRTYARVGMATSITPADVEAAHAAIRDHVQRTPTIAAPRLAEPLGLKLWLKLENLQFTGSFKDRGSCHKLQSLAAAATPPAGVVAASAGNHAQGVAFHAGRLGMRAVIVMPMTTPFSKVERTEAHGAEVVLHGESVAESTEHARQLAADSDLEFVHPYDDDQIVAGQATATLEMLEDAPDLDTLVVPIGGGGLCAGAALWAKHKKPDLQVFGVQTAMCPSMRALLRGEPTPPLRTHTLADGIAVKTPGKIPAAILKDRLEDVLLVDEEGIETAVALLAGTQKIVAEGAGAIGFGALLQHTERFAGRNVGVIVCGGNIDRRLLSTVMLRHLKREGKVAKLRIMIHDVPGVLAKVTQLIGASGADVVDIEHQRLFNNLEPREAELHVVMETKGAAHVARILGSMHAAGYRAELM